MQNLSNASIIKTAESIGVNRRTPPSTIPLRSALRAARRRVTPHHKTLKYRKDCLANNKIPVKSQARLLLPHHTLPFRSLVVLQICCQRGFRAIDGFIHDRILRLELAVAKQIREAADVALVRSEFDVEARFQRFHL